jgi:hypothetical protein
LQLESGTFCEWHGNRHLASQQSADSLTDALRSLVAILESSFGISAHIIRLNMYRDGDDFKPFHHDRCIDEFGSPQVTVVASFGSPRELSFRNAHSIDITSLIMTNGSVLAFPAGINAEFSHGVQRMGSACNGSRISLIIWGPKTDTCACQG